LSSRDVRYSFFVFTLGEMTLGALGRSSALLKQLAPVRSGFLGKLASVENRDQPREPEALFYFRAAGPSPSRALWRDESEEAETRRRRL
jgi:hypothetical protein